MIIGLVVELTGKSFILLAQLCSHVHDFVLQCTDLLLRNDFVVLQHLQLFHCLAAANASVIVEFRFPTQKRSLQHIYRTTFSNTGVILI